MVLVLAIGQELKAGQGCTNSETRSAVKPDAVVFVYSACSVDRACGGRMGRRGWGALTTAGVLGSPPGGGLLTHTQ